jgi:RNA recognition motif-containing protein
MNIYVGNLAADVTDNDLRTAFEAHGEVTSAKVISDMFTRQSKGFGFVEMPEETSARAAIAELNHKELKGKPIIVNEARPNKDNRGKKGQGGFRGGQRKW